MFDRVQVSSSGEANQVVHQRRRPGCGAAIDSNSAQSLSDHSRDPHRAVAPMRHPVQGGVGNHLGAVRGKKVAVPVRWNELGVNRQIVSPSPKAGPSAVGTFFGQQTRCPEADNGPDDSSSSQAGASATHQTQHWTRRPLLEPRRHHPRLAPSHNALPCPIALQRLFLMSRANRIRTPRRPPRPHKPPGPRAAHDSRIQHQPLSVGAPSARL